MGGIVIQHVREDALVVAIIDGGEDAEGAIILKGCTKMALASL